MILSHEDRIPRKKRFLTVGAIIIGVSGIVMLLLAVAFWFRFDFTVSTSAALVYGCFLLLMACQIWRKRSHLLAEGIWREGYWLTSSALIFPL